MNTKRHSMLLITILSVGLFLAGIVGVGLMTQSAGKPSLVLPSIDGRWVEQGVPHHVADRFTIRDGAIYQGGAVVTSQYQFDGLTLRYSIGQVEYLYKLVGDTFIREKPTHYQSIFSR